MRKKIIIGNWKMNKTSNEVKDFFKKFSSTKFNVKPNTIYGIAAPACELPFAVAERPSKDFVISSQDISKHLSGAYTGEISALMLKDLDVTYAIVGHSERRTYHKETNEDINQKAKTALENGITPIICVGETLDEYESNRSKEVVETQVKECVKGLNLNKIVIAYEPVWAIGTGKTATNDYAQEMCKVIRNLTSNNTLIQYGGSVTPDSIDELLKQPDVDGALVGGASLNAESFIKLIEEK
ncbi:MAG: triose-phosphate isomerase [Mycoplasma sp.]|nr:triose-phosphate isomerase [Mycoplasma sp.]